MVWEDWARIAIGFVVAVTVLAWTSRAYSRQYLFRTNRLYLLAVVIAGADVGSVLLLMSSGTELSSPLVSNIICTGIAIGSLVGVGAIAIASQKKPSRTAEVVRMVLQWRQRAR